MVGGEGRLHVRHPEAVDPPCPIEGRLGKQPERHPRILAGHSRVEVCSEQEAPAPAATPETADHVVPVGFDLLEFDVHPIDLPEPVRHVVGYRTFLAGRTRDVHEVAGHTHHLVLEFGGEGRQQPVE